MRKSIQCFIAFTAFIVSMNYGCSPTVLNDYTGMKSSEPATLWQDALISGNGVISAAMEAAGKINSDFDRLNWNPEQMKFVRKYITSTLTHFQRKYPELRFTFSFTSLWREIRAMNIKSFDVLELHFWLNQSERFTTRSGFPGLTKDRGNHDYSDYMDRLEKTMLSSRPMFLKDMHNRLAWAKEWSEEIGAPLTTTEAWGTWWHMDHKDLIWKWLYDWCEDCMHLASDYQLWGATP